MDSIEIMLLEIERVSLSKEDRELADYYKKKNLRDKGQLNEYEKAQIENESALIKKEAR